MVQEQSRSAAHLCLWALSRSPANTLTAAESLAITSWLITHTDTCPHTRTHTHMHRWLLLLHMASLALKACCKLQVIWSLCLKLQCGQNSLQCPADQTEIWNYHLQQHTNAIVHNALLKQRATRKCHCCICSMTQVVKLILRACLIKISFSLNGTAWISV